MDSASSALPLTYGSRPYLARIPYALDDYAAVRARLLERMAHEFPKWNPTLAAVRDRKDFSVVFMELFAELMAILNVHGDAYVNESYLRTATLPRSLMDLAELTDYRLAAGASSTTYQAFLAKKGGTVPAGFKVEAQPRPDAPALAFETAFELPVDPARNTLHLLGYDRSERVLRLRGAASAVQDTSILTDRAFPALAAGAPMVFDDGRARIAVRVVAATPEAGRTRVTWSAGSARQDHDSAIADLVVRARPKQTMRLTAAERGDEITLGSSIVPVANAAMFTIGAGVLLVSDGLQIPAVVLAKHVTASPAGTITLNRGLIASIRRSTTIVYEGVSSGYTRNVVKAGAMSVTRAFIKKSFPHDPAPGDTLILVDAAGAESTTVASVSGDTIFFAQPVMRALRPTSHPFDARPSVRMFTVSPGSPTQHATRTRPLLLGELSGVYQGGNTELELDRVYEELTAGTLLALSDGTQSSAHVLLGSAVAEDKSRVVLEGTAAADLRVASLAVYGPFDYEMRVDGHDRSARTLEAGASQLELDEIATGLAPGGLLVMSGAPGAEGARITAVESHADKTVVALARPLEREYPFADTVIYGNVVRVTHGTSIAEEILGSGDAAQQNQHFLLRRAPLTFLPDPSAPRGAASALEIFVDDTRWQIVDVLAASGPADQHVMLRIDDRERAHVTFGDGEHAARPPSGRNNIRARYRVSTAGLESNVGVGAIDKMPQALPFLDRTLNPLQAAGGADAETPDAARRMIGFRVRTLDRAVALADYAELALTFSGIAKARADWEHVGPRRIIVVTVAAEGGAPLTPELAEGLTGFLRARSSQSQRFVIRDAQRVPVRLALTVTLHQNVLRADAERRLLLALGSGSADDGASALFNFGARELGTDLDLATVYATVERVRGVDHALATAFHVEGAPVEVLDRIDVPAGAFASGGHPTDPAVGRLLVRLQGGIV